MKPCEKSLLKYLKLLILAYQFIETFGINSVAILPKDFSNSILFFSKALYTLINSFYILE